MPDKVPGMNCRYVNKPVRKKDAMALVTGQPVYTDDITPGVPMLMPLLRKLIRILP